MKNEVEREEEREKRNTAERGDVKRERGRAGEKNVVNNEKRREK